MKEKIIVFLQTIVHTPLQIHRQGVFPADPAPLAGDAMPRPVDSTRRFSFPDFLRKTFYHREAFPTVAAQISVRAATLFSDREALRDKHHSMLGFPARKTGALFSCLRQAKTFAPHLRHSLP